MSGSIWVAGGGKVRQLSMDCGKVLCEAAVEGCSAVCAHGETMFAAGDAEGVIYRLDKRLLPCGVCAGGPGMSALAISPDGKRLFVLLSDADSVMMLGGSDGAPMFLSRAGVNPRGMRLDAAGRTLAIAGGRDGSATLLCAQSLHKLCTFRADGMCVDALADEGRLYALMLEASLDSRLIVWEACGCAMQVSFPGLAGSLLKLGNALLVCAGQWLYVFDINRMRLVKKRFLGVCGRLMRLGRGLFLLCREEEALYRLGKKEKRLFCLEAKDAAEE